MEALNLPTYNGTGSVLFVAQVLSGTCGLVKYRCVSRLCEHPTDGG